ncbi:MAG TPA: peroxiredoxin-like family protein [Candidatus Binatia bacterium]|nr:peroxiredoxin-like family protein [Candidatus Binatia bacterium]
MAQLRRARAGYERRDARCLLVTTGTPEHTREFCAAREAPFACLVDLPGEPAYAAFGLAKVSLRALFGPSLLTGVLTVLRRWREVSMPRSGDVHQMSGAFVVDRDGIVRLAHRNRHPNDHPADETIWRCLDALPAAQPG